MDEDSFDNGRHVCRLKDGRLFGVMQHRRRHIDDMPGVAPPQSQYIFGRLSEDDGKTWGHPYFLYEWPDKDAFYCVSAMFQDSEGRIHIFGICGRSFIEGNATYLRFDSYRGDHPLYSDMEVLYRYPGDKMNMVETASGRLIVPSSTYDEKRNCFVSQSLYSDDHGDTWHVSSDIVIVDEESNLESGAVEPCAVEVQPGVIVMIIRTVLGRLWYSVSRDNGESWSHPHPTTLPSCNAPCNMIKMADGRIVLAWNDGLGYPYVNTRYSLARQCLHAAVSDDGLKTVRGVRMVLKKAEGDQDTILNNYANLSAYGEREILLDAIEVFRESGSTWRECAAVLCRFNPDFLDENTIENHWEEWVCDCPKTEAGIVLVPTQDRVAHAVTSFPYGTSGRLVLTTNGVLPDGCRVLLSDCYYDRLSFMPNVRAPGYEAVFAEQPIVALHPDESGEWVIRWDERTITLSVNGRVVQTTEKAAQDGYNHVTVLFEQEGELSLTGFTACSDAPQWVTGIQYE